MTKLTKSSVDAFFLETQGACDRPSSKPPYPQNHADRVDVMAKCAFGRWYCWSAHDLKVQKSLGISTLIEIQLYEVRCCFAVVCPVVGCCCPTKRPLHGDGCPCGGAPPLGVAHFSGSQLCARASAFFSEQGFWAAQVFDQVRSGCSRKDLAAKRLLTFLLLAT